MCTNRFAAEELPLSGFNPDALIARLGHGGPWIHALASPLSADELRFRPDHGAWSIAEILGHLADEEVEDFRIRLKLTLEDPSQPWPKIDPEASVMARHYNEVDTQATLSRFVAERRASIEWFATLVDPDWSRAYVHPRFGPQTAGMLLGSWVAHDALHIRQIAKRLHELAARDAGEFDIGYAGAWRA